jgi:hypothetical protein
MYTKGSELCFCHKGISYMLAMSRTANLKQLAGSAMTNTTFALLSS